MKKLKLSHCLLFILPFTSQAQEEDIYSKFLIEHKESSFTFYSRGTNAFEYICKKPSSSIDCRKEKIEYLKDKNNKKFNITKLIKVDDKVLYEIYLEKENYYLNAKRIINGLNSTHYFLDEGLYRDDQFEQEEVYLNYIMNKSFIINPKKIKKAKLILCNDRIELNICTSDEKEQINDRESVEIVDLYKKNKRHLIKLKLEKTNKEYWIEYYIFKILIQK